MRRFVLSVIVALALLMVASCGEKEELLEIQPKYIGETVTDVNYQFTKDDFNVYGIYTNDVTKTLENYEFEIETMNGGYFYIKFTYEDASNYCYVPCEVDIYSSEKE